MEEISFCDGGYSMFMSRTQKGLAVRLQTRDLMTGRVDGYIIMDLRPEDIEKMKEFLNATA